MAVEQFEDHPVADPQLARGQAGDQDLGEILWIEVVKVPAELTPEVIAQGGVGQDRSYRFSPGGLIFEGFLEQFGHVQDLDPVIAQRVREDVMLLLGTAHPGQRVKDQQIPVPRRDSAQLKARPVNQYRSEPANFAIDSVRMAHDFPPRSPASRRDDPL